MSEASPRHRDLYADCSDELRRAAKAYIDTAGHYSRRDAVRVTIER